MKIAFIGLKPHDGQPPKEYILRTLYAQASTHCSDAQQKITCMSLAHDMSGLINM